MRVTFAVLADTHKKADRGKIDCFGLFDTLYVWATPATREFSVAIGLAGIQKGESPVSVWLRQRHQRATQLGVVTVAVSEPSHSVIMATRVVLPISSVGNYEIGVAPRTALSSGGNLWAPLKIDLHAWPQKPDPSELERLLADPHTIKRARANFTCKKCERLYHFEAVLDPSVELGKGHMPFPKNGIFKCPECKTVHHIKDIEGQVLAQLGRSAPGVG